ncbi:ferredoxin--NADP+ reductase [Sporothrix brasiliensis 5110]|uniref:NADPH:adrenodoxin oxidoreductase, mitochondrial n=1 Tax=Sporothrix brasiliensis 5110 TaxID=1398154 RepID=A0A0C2IC28_9PEZI|nr:ferredoxin--NADP+ reductase [Sporothrix brasiliensis 5110]KIH86856.1 ferredoxin--NADP+ reductase [Sporothrix brasiliensis 5110]
MQPVIATCGARLRSPRLFGSAAWNVRGRLQSQNQSPYQARHASDSSGRRPLRMAVIGSGPAGFYTTYRVMAKTAARVDMYEALPVPFGLVRFGVAPDHPEVKNCQDKFEGVAQSPDFRFLGNVAVGDGSAATNSISSHNPDGGHVPLATLARHYDAIVFAYGASRDRKLGVPGEDLRGVYAARDFVGWYNGLPSGSDALGSSIVADLVRADTDTAVVVGQGNVALDVARMLLEHVDVLRTTDMSEAALEALARSRIKRVHVVGRRGPMQAAFTIKEVRELMKLPGVGLHPWDTSTLLPPKLTDLPRAQRRLMEVVAKGAATPLDQANKSWSLDFCMAPKHFAAAKGSEQGRVATAAFEKTHLAAPFDANAQPEHTGELVNVPTQLVFRSIGYRSQPLAGFEDLGIPFDERRGMILNDGLGRVLRDVRSQDASMTTEPYPGFYCAGWVKRGPTGVIASTMDDAFTTADAIVKDWEARAPFLAGGVEGGGWDGVKAEADTTGAKVVSWADWQKIDQVELGRGKELGKPRSKLTQTADMLAVLG